MSVNEKMTAIADNIRSKTGGTESLNLDDMASGVNEVYEAGKKAEYNEFWDKYNLGVQRAFAGSGWTKETFKPNRDFIANNYCFYYHAWQNESYDLAEQLKSLGVKILRANATQTFYYAWFSRLPILDFSKYAGMFDRTFRDMANLVTIDKIIMPPEGSVASFNQTFQDASKLKNITFEGVIDKSISFSASPLTVESLKSIISCLKDFAGTSSQYTYTVTFKTSAFNALEEEGTTAEYNGVACTWAELIDNKKWNLVKA